MGKSNIRNPNLRANLIQNRISSPQELSIACSFAGKKSAEARRKKRALRELARSILDMELKTEDSFRAELERRGMEQSEAAAILLAQLIRARAGDTEAARFLRDTSGQKPVDNVEIGNLDDKPFSSFDLTALSEKQLRMLVEDLSWQAQN